MIELYLRALNGEFSTGSRLALKAFFDSLPGFSLAKALNGEPQDARTSEQYGFLAMQMTKPLGGCPTISATSCYRRREIDIEDVVLNRRILVVLLPALAKAEEEMRNCGKIVVSTLKMTMAKVSGATLQGGYADIIASDQTRAPTPFIAVLDEIGYYMVSGIDVMMAQGRSLGFCIVIAGQDMAAMGKVAPQVAETALANASTLAVGKTVDGAKTMEYVSKVIGEEEVAVTTGMEANHGLLGQRWRDRQDVSFQRTARIKVQDLQNMAPGQFYCLFDGHLEIARSFYIGERFADEFSINRFVKIRGPLDRVPGLDQSIEEDYTRHLEVAVAGLAAESPAPEIDPDDHGEQVVRTMIDAAAVRPPGLQILGMLDALAAIPALPASPVASEASPAPVPTPAVPDPGTVDRSPGKPVPRAPPPGPRSRRPGPTPGSATAARSSWGGLRCLRCPGRRADRSRPRRVHRRSRRRLPSCVPAPGAPAGGDGTAAGRLRTLERGSRAAARRP